MTHIRFSSIGDIVIAIEHAGGHKTMKQSFHILMLSIACLAALPSIGRAEARIKDITEVKGARANHIFGIGLVVGLKGTGARTLSTQQQAIEMAKKLEQSMKLARQSILDNVYKADTIAQVWVSADLPPFARKGSRLDVHVSVMDDATSLEGGILVMTPLRAADNEVYATAAGPISIGGFRVRSNVPGAQMNHPTVAIAQNGGIVEREEIGRIDRGGCVDLLLRQPDFTTATRIMRAINRQYPATARTVDGGCVQIFVPQERRIDLHDFVGEVGLLSVLPDTPAKIVINERTGTVIVGKEVRISAVQIAHGNLSIKPNISLIPAVQAPETPQDDLGPPPNENADPVDEILKSLRRGALNAPANPQQAPALLHNVDQTFTVSDLARVLNALGASPRDLIAIFQALNRSGAMHAELVIN